MSDDGAKDAERKGAIVDEKTREMILFRGGLYHEGRKSLSTSISTYIAQLFFLVKDSRDERWLDEFTDRLLSDALQYRFAWQTLYRVHFGSQKERRESHPKVVAWGRAVEVAGLDTGVLGRPSGLAREKFFKKLDTYDLVMFLSDQFGLTKTRNDEAPFHESAADFAAEITGKRYNTIVSRCRNYGKSPVCWYHEFLRRKCPAGGFTVDARRVTEGPPRRDLAW